MILGFVFALFLLPLSANAAVLINEIAWMGTEISVNDEWIELYNSGEATNLDGWELTDGASLDISLTGTIGAGEYAVLERTDDTSALGTAFLIYVGALNNGGSTLVLKKPDGSIEDQVAGGTDWENIGGNNETKETAQLTTAGWITATATPGTENATVETNSVVEDDGASEDILEDNVVNSSSHSGGGSNKKRLATTLPVNHELVMSINAPDIAYVNQPVQFEAKASGMGKTVLDSLKYTWNFGDIYTGQGKEVSHSFRYSGNYVVVAFGAYSEYEDSARRKIIILPITFSITRTKNGDIQIHNNAKYETELNGFILKGDKEVVIPENTIILPNSTITIKKSRFETGSQKLVELYDSKKNYCSFQ